MDDIDKTIQSGGEETSIFEIMQRYRSDGSCESIIKDALVQMADQPVWGRGLEPLANIQNAVNGWFSALPLGDITQDIKDDLIRRVLVAVGYPLAPPWLPEMLLTRSPILQGKSEKRECPSCEVELSFYCSHCQQEFEQ